METTCPYCQEPVWDVARGHKLAKCWNYHPETGGTLAFDEMDDDDPLYDHYVSMTGGDREGFALYCALTGTTTRETTCRT